MQLRTDAMTWQVVDDEVVVLDLKGGSYFRVNGSGAMLWQLLAQPRTEDELADALIERFAIDRPTAASDASGFLSDLRDHRLLVE